MKHAAGPCYCVDMHEAPPPVCRWTRRAILGSGAVPALLAGKGQESPGEAKKFLDAATELKFCGSPI